MSAFLQEQSFMFSPLFVFYLCSDFCLSSLFHCSHSFAALASVLSPLPMLYSQLLFVTNLIIKNFIFIIFIFIFKALLQSVCLYRHLISLVLYFLKHTQSSSDTFYTLTIPSNHLMCVFCYCCFCY